MMTMMDPPVQYTDNLGLIMIHAGKKPSVKSMVISSGHLTAMYLAQ